MLYGNEYVLITRKWQSEHMVTHYEMVVTSAILPIKWSQMLVGENSENESKSECILSIRSRRVHLGAAWATLEQP